MPAALNPPARTSLFSRFLLAALVLALPSRALAVDSVTLLADSTISLAMAQVARSYARDRLVVVNASFAAPVSQEAQIKEGGAADILITPRLSRIEELKTQGLVDVYSQATVARNRLALVGPLDSDLKMPMGQHVRTAPLINAMGGEQAFVVANPQTLMEGTYSKEALRNLHAADDLEPYTLYIKSSGEMFDMVMKQHAYGVFLNSSLVGKEGLRVIGLLPEESHKPITYYAVVIAGENMDQARKFMEYLKGSDARRLLRENGLTID